MKLHWKSCAAALVLGLFGSAAIAQSAQTLKGKLVGTWKQVVSEATTPDGKKSFPFGESPHGILIFTEDGHFVQVHIASGIPKFASNSRPSGTAEENKAVVQGSIALFGTYTVDEAKKVVTYKVEASTYPNWDGAIQPRTIDVLSETEFVNGNPGGSIGGGAIAHNRYTRVRS
jgi:hypothetical protein